MEGIRLSTLWIYIGIIFSTDVYFSHCASVDVEDRLGVVGNNSVSLECRYSLGSGERFSSVTWSRKRPGEQQYVDVAAADGSNNSGYTDEGSDLVGRTILNFTDTLFLIKYQDVVCLDEAKYRCTVKYFSQSTMQQMVALMDLRLEAAPLKPETLTLTPDLDIFTEYQEVTFTCSGNVGKPAGSFWWFVYRGTTEVNKTSDARLDPPFPSAGPNPCTSVRTSKLTLNLSRSDDGLVVRCQVFHPTQMTVANVQRCALDSDLCLQTRRLVVQYAVRDITAYTTPPGPDFYVETLVTLRCSSRSNPPASFTWLNRDTNATFTGPVWTHSRLEVTDRGVYECTAKNTVAGVDYNVTASVNVNVVETTTPPPTTASSSTRTPVDGRTDKTIEDPVDGKATMTIIIVCVVVGVILLIVAVAVFIVIRRRRNKSQVEEPPEKPYNNHSNLNMYKTQPDLVSDEKKFAQNNSYDFKPEQDLAYSDLRFDDVPRSRRPIALRETTDYAHVQMPAV